jgi:hypothetical protein
VSVYQRLTGTLAIGIANGRCSIGLTAVQVVLYQFLHRPNSAYAVEMSACGSRIFEERNGQSRPHPDVVYRCAVCRLDVRFDPALHKMQPAHSPFVDRKRGVR